MDQFELPGVIATDQSEAFALPDAECLQRAGGTRDALERLVPGALRLRADDCAAPREPLAGVRERLACSVHAQPQSARAASTHRRSFARSSASVTGLPPIVLANPHCGLMASREAST